MPDETLMKLWDQYYLDCTGYGYLYAKEMQSRILFAPLATAVLFVLLKEKQKLKLATVGETLLASHWPRCGTLDSPKVSYSQSKICMHCNYVMPRIFLSARSLPWDLRANIWRHCFLGTDICWKKNNVRFRISAEWYWDMSPLHLKSTASTACFL